MLIMHQWPDCFFARFLSYILIQLVTSLRMSDIRRIHHLFRMRFMPYRFGPAVLTTTLKEIAMKLTQGSFTKRALMAALIAGSGLMAASSYAMPAEDPGSNGGCAMKHGQKAHAKQGGHRARHLSELKGKLKLEPGQEAAWNAFSHAGQPGMRHMGGDRKAQRGEFAKLNTPQRLDKMLAMSDARRAKMLERTQATKAFYAQLSPAQQSVFDAEAMPNRHWGHRHHREQS
jgi:protein CpxP